MPKTKRKFDWEIYDENGEFFDIITMTRDESRNYIRNFPHFRLQEIGYTE